MTTAYVSESSGILPKNQGEALVSQLGSEQRLQQQSTPACFVGHVVVWCSVGAINSVLSGGCFLLLPGMPKVL